MEKVFFYTGTYVLTVDSKYGLWYVKPAPLLQTLDTWRIDTQIGSTLLKNNQKYSLRQVSSCLSP